MNSPKIHLWNAWRENPTVQQMAEAYITKPPADWTVDDEQFYQLLHSQPDEALATILAVMQLTNDQTVLASLAAGPLEDFLGRHGEVYLDTIHALALEHRRLREVLNHVWQGSMTKSVWRRIELLKQSAYS
jgi:hypothetical protein